MSQSLASQLLAWHEINGRHRLPWNQTKNPFFIWVSEIILQQTRVEQGLPYYHRFIETFPTVHHLARASESKVLKLWEGLGYYSRGRNLRKGAQYVVENHEGKLPQTIPELLKIPGIGPYTASAVASFAFNVDCGVVDGNVYRIISRIYGIMESIQEGPIQKRINTIVQEAVPIGRSSDFNRAMMDLGATICTPKNPRCSECPVQARCVAHSEDLQKEIPYKHKRTQKKERLFRLGIILDARGELITEKRQKKDIWQGLDFLPELNDEVLSDFTLIKTIHHVLTHRRVQVDFFLPKRQEMNGAFYTAIENSLETNAFPVAVSKYLRNIQKG